MAINRITSHLHPWHFVINMAAELVRQAYSEERNYWYAVRGRDVGEYDAGRKLAALWRNMAHFMITNVIHNYTDFLHTQFFLLGEGSRCPSPRKCFGPAALRRWRREAWRRRGAEEDIALELALQKSYFESDLSEARGYATVEGWSSDDVISYALLDTENQLSPLFCYCAAVKSHLPKVAEEFTAEAMVQYLFGRKLYDKLWNDLIPATFRASALQIVPEVIC